MGLEREGIEILLACESDRAARQTIAANRPDLPVLGDIRDYSAAEIRQQAGLSQTEAIDRVVGGPPCQASSSAGKRQGFKPEFGMAVVARQE